MVLWLNITGCGEPYRFVLYTSLAGAVCEPGLRCVWSGKMVVASISGYFTHLLTSLKYIDNMLSLLSPALFWFLSGIVFFALEMFIAPAFVLFFFALGAWLTAMVVLFLDFRFSVQLLVFVSTSLVSLFSLRVWLKNIFSGKITDDTMADSDMVGAICIVAEDILPPQRGKVKYSGSFWQAEAEENIEKRTVVKIIGEDGLVLRVKKINPQESKQNELEN